MGVFLQNALFPGCDESAARAAVEAAAREPGFHIAPENCRYAQNHEGTQVLIGGNAPDAALLARALSDASENPVMLLYIFDGDYWGYDFCAGKEEDHFSTLPDYFRPASQEEKQRLNGNPDVLLGWFPVWDISRIGNYYVHWSDLDTWELEDGLTAYPNDQYPYGDCWQMLDFAARLGFPWPFDGLEGVPSPPLVPVLPTLCEILERELPPLPQDNSPEFPLLDKLPTALSPAYIRKLLEENGVRAFGFLDKTPREVMDTVNTYCWKLKFPRRDPLCQRLSVLAAFCSFWAAENDCWGFLDAATYEPVYGSYEKPTDIYVLRARAAVTGFTKRHRALKDLRRLIELDPANHSLYQAEIERWNAQERTWAEQAETRHEDFFRQCEEQERQKAEKEARRLDLILAKRRKKP